MFHRKKEDPRDEIKKIIEAARKNLFIAPATCLGDLHIALLPSKRLSHQSLWIQGVSSLLSDVVSKLKQNSKADKVYNQLEAFLARLYVSFSCGKLGEAAEIWSEIDPKLISKEDNDLAVDTLKFLVSIKDCNADIPAVVKRHRDASLKKQPVVSEDRFVPLLYSAVDEPEEKEDLSFLAGAMDVFFGASKQLFHFVRENPGKLLLLLAVFNDTFFLNRVSAAEVGGRSTADIMMSLPPEFSHLDVSRLATSSTVTQFAPQQFSEDFLINDADSQASHDESVVYTRRLR